jgi:hypothetical protein
MQATSAALTGTLVSTILAFMAKTRHSSGLCGQNSRPGHVDPHGSQPHSLEAYACRDSEYAQLCSIFATIININVEAFSTGGRLNKFGMHIVIRVFEGTGFPSASAKMGVHLNPRHPKFRRPSLKITAHHRV